MAKKADNKEAKADPKDAKADAKEQTAETKDKEVSIKVTMMCLMAKETLVGATDVALTRTLSRSRVDPIIVLY